MSNLPPHYRTTNTISTIPLASGKSLIIHDFNYKQVRIFGRGCIPPSLDILLFVTRILSQLKFEKKIYRLLKYILPYGKIQTASRYKSCKRTQNKPVERARGNGCIRMIVIFCFKRYGSIMLKTILHVIPIYIFLLSKESHV